MRTAHFATIGLALTILTAPITGFAQSSSSAASVDKNCLNQAVTDRATSLKDAYKAYADAMAKGVDTLTKGEQDAIKNKDMNYVNIDTSRAFGNFSYTVGDAWNRLNVLVAQAWNNYYGKRASCYGAVAPGGYGGYGYGSYGYSGYGYGNYGNYYGGYPARCSTPVLPQPQPGCYYECASDENGCQRCHQACRDAVSYSSCGCTSQYDPVCTRYGRTYDNACIAVCKGEQVWYDGACR